jgi:ribosomal protein S6--L-glutamate ligase/gamma-F420-2:alpha-L-glutamate ligase
MRGLVIINGYPNAEKFLNQGRRICAALRAEGIETDLIKNGEISACVKENGQMEVLLSKAYDFAVYLDKDKYLGKMLEGAGLRLFNSAAAVEVCDDKLSTYLALGSCGVRLAPSIPAPLCYTKDAIAQGGFLENVAKKLGFPLVAKKSYGSFGAGVQLVHGMPELQKVAEECLHEPHFFQEYIKESCGRDIRVIVVGGKALGGMERVAKEGEFRSNIELGGVGRKIELKREYAEAAERAAKALGLDYCGVDLLQTKEGPVLCEVNSNAFFEGFEKATGLDIAKVYAEYIVSVI